VAVCAPVTGCGLLPGDRIPVDGCGARWLPAVDVSSSPENALPLEAQPHGSAPAMPQISSGPAGAGVRRAWRRNGPGPDHRPRRAGPRRARRPIQSLADRIAGRFSGGGAACWPLASLCFLWQWGTRLVAQVVGRRGPRVMAAWRACVLGAVAGNAFFNWRFQLAIGRARGGLPCPWALATPHSPSPWERAWRLAPACCSAVAMRSR